MVMRMSMPRLFGGDHPSWKCSSSGIARGLVGRGIGRLACSTVIPAA
jgi:hypothetical protein